MKRHLYFIPIALLALSARVQAEGTVSVYGLMDTSVEVSNVGNGTQARMTSGGLNSPRIGFKGSEDIGGGYNLKFVLEQGIVANTGAASNPSLAFSRQSWIGVGAPWGEVRLGLQNSPVYLPVTGYLDAFAVGTIASGLVSFLTITPRSNNAISYHTPNFNGLAAQFMVSLRDSTATSNRNGLASSHVGVEYDKGPFSAAIGYQRVESADGSSLQRALFAGGSYAFGPLRIYVGFHNAKKDNVINKNVYTVSAMYNFNTTSAVSFGGAHLDDKSGKKNNGDQVGLMYWHFLSKRTTLYVSGAFLKNHNQAIYTMNGASTAGIPVDHPGANARGIAFGIQHRF